MDKTLAEIYGTNQSDDQEKLAAAAAAEELTEDGALDLEGLTEEDLEAVAAEVLEASAEGEAETEEVEESDEEEKTASEEDLEEKVAEADQMGRIMAHAYVQELRSIEKTAGAKIDALKAGGKKMLHRAGRGLEAVGKKLTPTKSGDKAFSKGKLESMMAARKKGAKMKDIKSGMTGHRAAGHEAEGKLHKRVGGAVVGGGALAVGGGVAAAKGGKSKKASALDTLAEQRAQEILAANGVTEQETETTKYDVLADAVEQRATEMLAEAGYEFADESAEE
jgi:hypothetical protein